MTIPDLSWFVGDRPVVTAYAVLVLTGVLVTLFYMMHLAKRLGYDDIRVLYLELWCFAAAYVGGHVLGALVNFDRVLLFCRRIGTISSYRDLKARLEYVFSDNVFFGGLILALIFTWFYIRKTEPDRAPYYDMAAVGIPLFHGFGRLGCFFTGCCYGMPWAHGVAYARPLSHAEAGVALFPVQLIEAILNFALFFLLRRLFLKGKARGRLLLLYLLIYPSYRFLLEFFRGDRVRGFVGFLSTSQFISLLLIAFGSCCWLLSQRKGPAGRTKGESYDASH